MAVVGVTTMLMKTLGKSSIINLQHLAENFIFLKRAKEYAAAHTLQEVNQMA
jgi:hypothetical protein